MERQISGCDRGGRAKIVPWLAAIAVIALLAVGAMIVSDIFRVEYNGVTRMSVDGQGNMTLNTDSSSSDAALKFLSASNQKGDIRFVTRAADPTNPQNGEIWYNSTGKVFKYFDGTVVKLLRPSEYALYPATQTVADYVPGSAPNHCTLGANSNPLNTDPVWTTDAKLGGCALSFDGSNDSVRSSVLSNTSTCTIEAWLKIPQIPASTTFIVGFGNGWNSGQEDKTLCMDASGKLYFIVWDVDALLDKSSAVPADPLPVNQWVHIAGSVGGGYLRTYVNGVEVGLPAVSGVGNTDTSYNTVPNIFIGAKSVSFAYFRGLIDEVAVWNSALSLAEIQARFNGGNGVELTGNEPGLLHVWHLNDAK